MLMHSALVVSFIAATAAVASDDAGAALLPEASEGYVYITRHGEKSVWYGCLNATGRERAAAFPSIFNGEPRRGGRTLYTPTALMAFHYDDGVDCERCIETLQPIAKHLGLQIQHTLQSTNASDGTQLAVSAIRRALATEQIAGNAPVVLVTWEHHHITELAQSLGVAPQVIPEWPQADFDTVFQLVYHGTTLHRFSQASEDYELPLPKRAKR